MKRLFKFFFQVRPLKARYLTFWPVDKVLDVLKTWYPLENLSLRQLTLKTAALIALSSSDRGQTLHLAKLCNMLIEKDCIKFVIKERTKSTRKVLRPTIITCISCKDLPELDVAKCVSVYIEKFSQYRPDNVENLFLSWKTKRAVSRQTIARWLKIVLKIAGIDTSIFTAHCFRGAGLSKAYNKGTPMDKIIAAGNWSNAQIFKQYYCAPSYDSSIGNIILNN